MADLTPVRTKEVDVEQRAASPTDSGEKLEKVETHRPTPIKWAICCAGLWMGAFLYGLDTTIAADVQASVYERFHDIEKLAWVGIGFPMGSVSIILLVGACFGLFNSKWLMVGFFTAFEAGSALCGGAPTIEALIIGRVIAGMGGAGMYLGCLTYVEAFTTVKERPIYNAATGLCWGAGAILGPVIGGAFSVNPSTTWRWAFYINLPLAGALAPVYLFLFPNNIPHREVPTLTKLARVDWAGAVLNASTWVFFIVALTFSGSDWKWSDPGAIVMWVLFGVSLIAFVTQQGLAIFTTKERRLFPVHLLRSRTMLSLYVATAAASTATGIAIYYIPLLFQFSRGDSALKAAVRLLPFIIPNVVAMMFNGALLPVTKRYAPWYLVGGALVLVGGSLLYEISSTTHTAAIYGFEVLISIGGGFTFQIAYSVVATKLKGADIPAGIGYINVSQIGSMAIALSIAGSIFQNVGLINLKQAMASYDLPEDLLRAALAGAQSAAAGAFTPEMQQSIVDSVVKTIATVFSLEIAAGAVMLVAAVVMRWEKLDMTMTAGG